MKNKHLLGVALCVFFCHETTAQFYLYDDFNDGAIDSSLWNLWLTGFGNSSLTEVSGNARFINGAGLITVSPFMNASVEGRFQMIGDSDDRFSVILRSDGTTFDSNWQTPISGIGVEFRASGNPTATPTLQIVDLTTTTLLGQATPAIGMSTYYDFLIVDSGSDISVFLGGNASPVLSATSSLVYGNKVEIFNREQAAPWGPQHTSEMDFVTISQIPEPQSLFLLGGLGILGYFLSRRETLH